MIQAKFLVFLSLALLGISCSQSTGSQPPAASAVSGEPESVVLIDDIEGRYDSMGLAQATFAGGCFWCTEAVFDRIQGVEAAYSGYTGGTEKNPSYELVCSGATNFAEAVRIYYDSTQVDYHTLLELFFASHDPTQLNRQGPDVGLQYRSAIFYHDEHQRKLAESYIQKLHESGKYDHLIVTELSPAMPFYKAEGYHQNYYERHPDQPYIQHVSRPKVEKVAKEYKELWKGN